ncbi:NACHT domain-containing protein [Micromonospora carbonacea]|uniref:NACHT domain-containing protein n=1 Tax=Micromonospora carbonacea TaxID=47853 RepID=A0A1C5AYS6_9ACTN|nr:NACHT domain-containing protein [Micromonospora carbonacea]SCF50313.1 NACHT domain-containing protein [Micromonospora carbonacea]
MAAVGDDGGVWRVDDRARPWWLLGTGVTGMAATALLLVQEPPAWLDTADQLGSVAGALLGAVSLAVAVAGLRAARRPVPVDPATRLEDAVDELARQVRRQWDHEAGVRGLLRPEPLRVRWSSTGRPVTGAPVEVFGATGGQVRLFGEATEVIRLWRQLPARQLVVIGAAGAGKTSLAVLLTLDLLKDRQDRQAVPVLLPLAGWDPRKDHVDTWLARRLIEFYPVLADRGSFGRDAAVRLVDGARIVPVLDGLDEMPPPLRAAAVRALTEVVGRDRPLVLTCRAEEYQETIAATGTPLARAAVVEIEPLTGQQAGEYLPAGQINGAQRWAPVIAHLRAHPRGPLAQVLSTPLMVYLARTAYTPPHTDPDALTRFTDPADVEEHLLQAYLPAIYNPRTPSRPDDPPALHHYPPGKAHQWLTVLARHLQQRNSRDLNWWHLTTAVHPAKRAAVPATVAAGTAAAVAAVVGTAAIVVVVVVVVAVAVMLAAALDAEDFVEPTRFRVSPRKLAEGLAGGLAIGLAIGLADGLAIGLAIGLADGLAIGLTIGLTIGLGFVLLSGPEPVGDELPDPRLTLHRDRALFLTGGLGFGLVFVLAFGPAFGPAVLLEGVLAGLVFGPPIGLVAGFGRAWFRFGLARIWLGTQWHLPWRVMRFLDDAYRRGVLRQVGAAYQFRHARLQDHLANADRARRPGVAGGSPVE